MAPAWNKITYQKLYDNFESLGAILITTEQELGSQPPTKTKVLIVAECGHERTIAWTSFSVLTHYNCVACNTKIGRVNQARAQRFTYEEFCQRLTDHGCKLLMSREEYDEKKIRVIDQITFLASCGHERTNAYETMYSSKDWKCKQCTHANVSEKLKIKGKTDGISTGSLLEYHAFEFMKNVVKDFKIIKSYEGCKSDFIIKPVNENRDEWLQIQLKTTGNIINNKYQFDIKGIDYSGMLILAICIKDSIAWAIPGYIVKNFKTLTCSSKDNTKYKPYQFDISEINVVFQTYYLNILKINFEDSYISNNPQGKQEYQYAQKRINCLKLPFMANPIENTCSDFSINNRKIQEKVLTKYTSNGYKYEKFEVTMAKCNGRKNGKMTYRPYDEGDNDFYWFHIPKYDQFYIIPEEKLVRIGMLRTESQPGKIKIGFYPVPDKNRRKTQVDFAVDYLFDYSDENLFRIKTMFDL